MTEAIGAKRVEEITLAGFERYVRDNIEKFVPTTLNGDLRITKTFLNWLRTRKHIKKNELQGAAPLPDMRDPKRRALTEDEIKKLIGVEKRGLLWRFLISTGLCLGELTQLKRKDVDLASGLVHVRPSTAKRARKRSIPLVMSLRKKLDVKFNGVKPEAPAFTTNQGTAVGNNLRKQLKKDCKKVGVDPTGVDVHALRKSFATRLIHRGVDPKTVQYLLGHNSINTTMQIYTEYVVQSSERTMTGLEIPE